MRDSETSSLEEASMMQNATAWRLKSFELATDLFLGPTKPLLQTAE